MTFVDRSINRVPFGNSANPYRQRGDYRSSTWGRWTATRFAEDYKLQQVAQWPITTLGVHCVVYEIPLDQYIDRVLESLARDRRVD